MSRNILFFLEMVTLILNQKITYAHGHTQWKHKLFCLKEENIDVCSFKCNTVNEEWWKNVLKKITYRYNWLSFLFISKCKSILNGGLEIIWRLIECWSQNWLNTNPDLKIAFVQKCGAQMLFAANILCVFFTLYIWDVSL